MQVASRLMLTIMATFVLVCLLFLSINLAIFWKNAYKSFEARAQYLTELSVNANSIAVWNFDEAVLAEFAKFLTQEDTVVAVIFEIDEPQLDKKRIVGYGKRKKAIKTIASSIDGLSPPAGDYKIYAHRQMIYKDNPLGRVHLYFTDRPIIAEVERQALTFAVLVGCFVLVYGAVVYLVMKRSFLSPFKNVHRLALWVSAQVARFNDHFNEQNRLAFAVIPRLETLEKEYLEGQDRNDDMGDFVRAFISLINGFSMVVATLSDYSQRLEKMNDSLEERIKERTQELAASNQKLQTSLDSLKQTQAQMVQQEKLASIGQLAAGVAHEINNPIGYVSSNINRLGEYFEDLTQLIDSVEQVIVELPALVRDDANVKWAERLQQADFEFVRTDLPDLLNDCREGTHRVREIVQSLKDFSRVDQGEANAELDINDAVKTTLKLVWNELKYDCEVTQELQCTALAMANLGQINQVISNLLVNASHAIKATKTRGTILIKTYDIEGFVVLEVGDTGCGIPEEARSKVFDPFFTTKPVGQGTGLGLNICYDIIVNKHGGSLTFTSETGKGTTFTVKLPIKKAGKMVSESDDKGA